MRFKEWLQIQELTDHPLPATVPPERQPQNVNIHQGRGRTNRLPMGMRNNPSTGAFPTGSLPGGSDRLPGNRLMKK